MEKVKTLSRKLKEQQVYPSYKRLWRQASIDTYVPDNQFRSRAPCFADHKGKYVKKPAVTGRPWDGARRSGVIPASEFKFDAANNTCMCPEGNSLSYRGTRVNRDGDTVAHFEGRLLQCRHCPLKAECMVNPKAADHGSGNGRQGHLQPAHARGGAGVRQPDDQQRTETIQLARAA